MKKRLLVLLFLIINGNFINAQNSLSETRKLASLAKIYGFLKYYHPEVSKGKFEWDKEFLKYLPEVLKAKDKESLSTIYINWIDSLGEIKVCRKCNSEEKYFDKNFDLSWFKDTLVFTNTLKSKLKYIEENRNQKENFYVSNEPVGKIKITNELLYKDFEYPNEQYRLLGLFKYWNIIEYFYPYKYLMDQNWDSVLIEIIPKIRKSSNKREYQSTIRELVAKLDDTHAWISFSKNRVKYFPFKISHIENKAVVSGYYNDSIADLNNIKKGDIILNIDNVDIKTEIDKNLKYVAGSNNNIKIKYAYNKIFSKEEKTAILTIKRGDKIKKLLVNRYDFNVFSYWNNPKKIKSKSISEKVGYINMANVKFKDVAAIFESFEHKESIIIDLRNYPAFIYKYFTRFVNSERRDFCKIYSPVINYPGKFYFKKNLETSRSKKAFNGKIIILVNEETISRSEFTAMAFQTAENVITIGSQTAGADGDVAVFEYIGGYKTAISGNGVLYPDGRETQRKGIKIDVEIKQTVKGLREGRDEILEKAIQISGQ